MGTNRREFLKLGGAAVAGLAVGEVMPTRHAQAVHASITYPRQRIATLGSLATGAIVSFGYPDPGSPAILFRMGEPVLQGVGPEQDVVAYSVLCTHKGCKVAWKPERKLLICPCHWSTFDPAKAGVLVIGQASANLPRIELEVDEGGEIFATGVSGLIYGRHANVL